MVWDLIWCTSSFYKSQIKEVKWGGKSAIWSNWFCRQSITVLSTPPLSMVDGQNLIAPAYNIELKRWKKLRWSQLYLGTLVIQKVLALDLVKSLIVQIYKSRQIRFQNSLDFHFGYPSAKLDAMLIMMMRFPIWHLPVSPSECCCNSSMPDSAKCTT